MRDVVYLPAEDGGSLIIASDNSGGIGKKPQDLVDVPYGVTAYFAFRTAVMECMAAGGEPQAVVMQNFCGEKAWADLAAGISRGQQELGIQIPVTGSTESNMEMVQSALGIVVIGRQVRKAELDNTLKIGVIGRPLVGPDVIRCGEWVAPLSLFKWCCGQEGAEVLPVGSKGIAYEWEQFNPRSTVSETVTKSLDVNASGGPSTCFLIAYQPELEDKIKGKAGDLFCC